MRSAFLALVASLLLAPLAAQAAQPPVRYAVTLRGTLEDTITYVQTRNEEECIVRREGNDGRELTFRSVRPTRIEVRGSSSRAVYRPSRVAAVRLAGGKTGGSSTETRRCRGAPSKPITVVCKPKKAPARAPRRLGFRGEADAIIFRPPARPETGAACGLDGPVPVGWLSLAPGRVDNGALVAGRSKVIARASGTREEALTGDPTVEGKVRSAIRWTLTFRRIG